MNIVLASASIRRQELLKRVIDNFEIITSNFNEESIKYHGDSASYVMALAKGKCLEVATRLRNRSLVIGCDTIVIFKGEVLGKPRDEQHAYEMLKLLSGSTHEVYSGISIYDTETTKLIKDYIVTKVEFSTLSDEDIKNYIKTKEPMDKAGAYGIQGIGGIFVRKIDGCFYNVVGLPLNRLNCLLKEMGGI